jgi:hypothetical protein
LKMSNVTAIVPRADDKQDPLRAALDSAIKMAWKATCAVTAAAESLERGRSLVAGADAAVEAATTAVGEARELDAKNAAKAVRMRGDVGGASAARKARRELEEAEEDAEVARSALAKLEGDLADAEDQARWRANAVCVARNNLLLPLAEQLLARAHLARRTVFVAQSLLSEMLSTRDDAAPKFPDVLSSIRAREQREAPLAGIRSEAHDFSTADTEDEQAAAEEAVSEMRAFIDALLQESTAEAPALPA